MQDVFFPIINPLKAKYPTLCNVKVTPYAFISSNPSSPSLPQATRETAAVADSLRGVVVEVTALCVLAHKHDTLPLARVSPPVKVEGVVQSRRQTSLGHARLSGRAHAVGGVEVLDNGREEEGEQVAGVGVGLGVTLAGPVVVEGGATEEGGNVEGGAAGDVGAG